MTNFHITHRNEVAHWEEVPFAFEHAMAGYILDNPQILKLNDNSFSEVRIKGAEVPIGSGGRADITVLYEDPSGGIQAEAIIELKNVTANSKALNQLRKYLSNSKKSGNNYSIGVLVAPDFGLGVIQDIKQNKVDNIYGIKISRYENDDEYIVVADIIYPESRKKDYTRYSLENIQKITTENLSKAMLVWYIVESYAHSKQNISYNSLHEIFSDDLHTKSKNRSIHLIEEEKNVPDNLRCRYSRKSIVLDDGTGVLVSNQWGIDNIQGMIDKAHELGMKITTQNNK